MNGVNEYIGMRYVPIFADPVEWDDTRSYESLTIVTYQGASYTSRRPIPAGIPITDGRYWVITSNYNAQVELYRQEVRAFDGRITQAQSDASDALTAADYAHDTADTAIGILAGYGEGETVEADITTLQNEIDALDTKVGTLPEGETSLVGYVDGKVGTLPEGETSLVGYVDGKVQEINTDLTDVDTTLAGFSPSVPVKPYVDAAVAQQRKKMLVIGDSLSGSTYVAANARWCVLLAARLNADLYVFQANGAGYSAPGVGGKTFQTLVADAHTSTQFNDEDIDYLFIFGGTNDISETMLPSAITGAFDDTLTAARQYFTNATMYVCSPTARYDHLKLVSSTRHGEIYQLKAWRKRQTLATTGAVLLPLTFVLGFDESFYVGGSSDHIHLNATGHAKVANAIWNMMNGVALSTYFTGAMLGADDSDVGTFRCSASASGIQVFGYTQAAAGADSYLHDQFLILRDAGFENFWNGTAITGSNGGYVGAYNAANGGLHFVGYGAFNSYAQLV